MTSVSESQFGAGGKVVTNRRKTRLAVTPYDRPSPPPPPARSPNWFSGVIIPSARAIASGAGKIITSVLYSDYSSSEDDDESDFGTLSSLFLLSSFLGFSFAYFSFERV